MHPRLSPRLFGLRLGLVGGSFSSSSPGGWPTWFSRLSRSSEPEPSVYSVRTEESGLRFIRARGGQPRITSVLLEAVRAMPGNHGMVLVELRPSPREWIVTSVSRPRVLESLLSIRDLLGQGHIDLAVFSRRHGVEVFLDRFGTLEIRSGAWFEPRLRALFESRGFQQTPRLSVLPRHEAPIEWIEEHEARVRAVIDGNGFRPVPYRNRKAQSG